MNIDGFLIKLLFLVVPGYIGYGLSIRIRGNSAAETDSKNNFVFVNIFVFTVFCYILYDLIFYVISVITQTQQKSIFSEFYSQSLNLSVVDFLILIGLALSLGVVYSVIENQNILNRFFKFVDISRVTNQGDLWSNVVTNRSFEWIIFRDHELGLSYNGFIKEYSETGRKREIVLGNVEVSETKTGKRLYDAELIYLSREYHNFTIEVKPIAFKEKKNAK